MPSDGDAQDELVEALKTAMTDRGWKQVQFAEAAGVSTGTVSNVLNSKGVPSASVLDDLLRALGITGERWKELHALRQRADSRTKRLDRYLAAAEAAVREHPYAGVLPGEVPPLASVYVRQLARQEDTDAGATAGVHAAAGPRPADELLAQSGTCVVVAGPGGGKSSLLRTYLADTVTGWRKGKAGPVLAVLVPAAALLGAPLAEALAQYCNADLVGLVERLPVELFAKRPHPRTRWLVLVDGLDEVTDAQSRQRVLRALAAVAGGPQGGQYRFVVATRPLPRTELGTLGTDVPHYQLEPFTRDGLRDVARAWFRALHLPDPDTTADRFLAAVHNANLTELARTPLMATMLCQLQAAEPHQALPTTRGAVYDRFTHLLHQRQYAPSTRAVLHAELHNYGPGATARVDDVLDHLPELIGHLAAARLAGDTRPALDILHDHPRALRPARVSEEEWDTFLTTALCRSGLITSAGSDLAFLHQTLLEHQAARHAARDEQARTQTLKKLLTPAIDLADAIPLLQQANFSYTGFVLDCLLAAKDRIAEQTTQALTTPTALKQSMCHFLANQVRLRTGLPASAVDHLALLAADPDLTDDSRMDAAAALAEVEGRREAGANLLAALSGDSDIDGSVRVGAAAALAEMEGHRGIGANLLIALVGDPDIDGYERLYAAEALAGVEGYRRAGVNFLAILAGDSDIEGSTRVGAAAALAEMEGHREAGVNLLAALAGDPGIDGSVRVHAAATLAGMEGRREAGVNLLAALAGDPGIDGSVRVHAAEALAEMKDHREAGVNLLVALAGDPGIDGRVRLDAARFLVRAEDHREAGANLLVALADNPDTPG
ncbi:helix-turn-helix domain-containing protein, partial [Kitasatospora cineracea]|uniref:helix-turn-helix domain-containing protein n=1 Tax=Kitasatospora cineracea TaxID=88074 RepID=UPI0036DD6D7E